VTDERAAVHARNVNFDFRSRRPPFKNKGNYVISLNKINKCFGSLVEAAGVNVFKNSARELVYDGDGIRDHHGDKGVDKTASRKTTTRRGTSCAQRSLCWPKHARSLTETAGGEEKLDNIIRQSLRNLRHDASRNCGTYSRGNRTGHVAHRLGWPVFDGLCMRRLIYGFIERPRVGRTCSIWSMPIRIRSHTAFRFGRPIRS